MGSYQLFVVNNKYQDSAMWEREVITEGDSKL